jgi:hypothetical protein
VKERVGCWGCAKAERIGRTIAVEKGSMRSWSLASGLVLLLEMQNDILRMDRWDRGDSLFVCSMEMPAANYETTGAGSSCLRVGHTLEQSSVVDSALLVKAKRPAQKYLSPSRQRNVLVLVVKVW